MQKEESDQTCFLKVVALAILNHSRIKYSMKFGGSSAGINGAAEPGQQNEINFNNNNQLLN